MSLFRKTHTHQERLFTWHGLSRSGGESLPPTILRVATSISQTPVVSIGPNRKLETQRETNNSDYDTTECVVIPAMGSRRHIHIE